MPEVVGWFPLRSGHTVIPLCKVWTPDCYRIALRVDLYVRKMCSTWKFFEGSMEFSHREVMTNVRLVKSCEWLPHPVQDYKPIPLPLFFPIVSCQTCREFYKPYINMFSIPSLLHWAKKKLGLQGKIFCTYFNIVFYRENLVFSLLSCQDMQRILQIIHHHVQHSLRLFSLFVALKQTKS